MKLLPSQKNQVYDLIARMGFSRAQFKIAEQSNEKGSKVE